MVALLTTFASGSLVGVLATFALRRTNVPLGVYNVARALHIQEREILREILDASIARCKALEAQLDAALDRVMARTLPEYDARRPVPDLTVTDPERIGGRYLSDPTGLFEAFVPDPSPVPAHARAQWERAEEDL